MSLASRWGRLKDEPGFLGRIRRQWPWCLVVGVAAVGIILIAMAYWRRGAATIGVAMILGGILRAIVKDPGILVIRRLWIDLIVYFGVGIGIMIVALVASPT